MHDISELYRQLVLIRYFEEESLRLANDGLIPGVIHPYTGHEAVAVGALAHRDPDEWVVGYYRCHGHALASGSAPEPLLREMLDRSGAVCEGKSGSMQLCDRSAKFLLASSIVASQLSIATGVAFAEKAARDNRAVVVFCGDGALGAGVAYESLMIALRLNLPLMLVCEDNGWQDHTSSDLVMPHRPATLLRNLGLATQEVDGNDVLAMATAAATALTACRRGEGPQVLVAKTYLRDFHSQMQHYEPGNYRPEDQVAAWLARDPLDIAASHVRAAGLAVEPLRAAAVEVVDRAVAGAVAAPPIEPELALTTVTAAPWPAEPDERWSR
nr:thiamine pyrophosphate-dependent dehydrogenase E1 component subunit alpha [Kibdelosporangium sp. MJ126-NF4]CEL12851.1 Pyruvate dehydrogenase E1 component alpha subunit [Kibdelosporangium sp. MJ126-NF4]CTQ98537.1 Pyruvate dehydrogenase E1 component alpha subunit (EC 1.2.4.1) [Kibdelosporangium sp. MJ126-NF4]